MSTNLFFRLFDRFDMLDIYVTPIADGFENRAIKLEGFKTLDYYVLSKEDIIVNKLGRFSDKDKEDIDTLIKECDLEKLNILIHNVVEKEDFSLRIKAEFIKNTQDVRMRYHV